MTSSYQKLLEQIPMIEERIAYTFQRKERLVLAFVHRSFFHEHRTLVPEPNERLEFLGDAVLGLLVSEYLYEAFPDLSEGQLSHLRANLVEAGMCARLLRKLQISEFLLLGKGEKMQSGSSKESIQADLFEALLASVYLDGGLAVAHTFFWSHFREEIDLFIQQPVSNWKAELQDFFQKRRLPLPVYQVLKEGGPDHSKVFEVGVMVEERLLGSGIGSSKKEAEQIAAKEALARLKQEDLEHG